MYVLFSSPISCQADTYSSVPRCHANANSAEKFLADLFPVLYSFLRIVFASSPFRNSHHLTHTPHNTIDRMTTTRLLQALTYGPDKEYEKEQPRCVHLTLDQFSTLVSETTGGCWNFFLSESGGGNQYFSSFSRLL
jgi:hypothetical protein